MENILKNPVVNVHFVKTLKMTQTPTIRGRVTYLYVTI